jgi:hypothetical protein
MDTGTGSGRGRDVAVGQTREAAAAVFGAFFDDAVLTTYTALDADVELAEVGTLGMVAGPGLSAALGRISSAGATPERLLAGIGTDLSGRDDLLVALDEHPEIAVAGVEDTARAVLVQLGRSGEVSPADDERLRDELRRRTPLVSPVPDAVTAVPEDAAAPVSTPSRRPSRLGLGVAGAVALVAAVVVLAIGLGNGTHGLLVALAVLSTLAQAALLAGLAYAVRLLRGNRADLADQQRVLLTRTEQLVKLTRNAARQDKDVLREVEQVREEVLALGRLQARARIEAREQP